MNGTSSQHPGSLLFVLTVLAALPGFAQTNTSPALLFDGVDDLVVVSNNPLFELTSGTVELWFQPNWTPGSLAYDPVLLGDQLGPLLTRYSIHVDRTLSGVTLANGTSSSFVPCSFAPGQWTHLAVVANGPAAQVYVNGQLVGSTTNTFGTLIGLPLNLGSDGAGAFFPGVLDEVRLWNIPRSATDLRYNMSRALTGREPGLVAYWRLNEGVGTIALDATANHLDGVLEGPAWTNTGVVQVNTSGSFGMALDFSSSRNCYVQVPVSGSLVLSNQFTFEAWVKPGAAKCNTILSRGDGVNLTNTDFILQVGSDGTNCGVMKVALMTGGNWITSASLLPLNAWAHLAMTSDGVTNRFYINGILDNAVAATGGMVQSGLPLFIGCQGTAGTNCFEGALDEVRIWNTVRTAAQIQGNVNQTLAPNQPGLVGYWKFDEQPGLRAVDSSGHVNHGTLVNRPVHVPSFWAPVLVPNGSKLTSIECHGTFADPGATPTGLVTTIASGEDHGLLVRPDGTALGWGAGFGQQPPYFGQGVVPAGVSNVVSVAAGLFHSLALTSSGNVLAWGYNSLGETNVPPGATNVVAIQAASTFSLALGADGVPIVWGQMSSGISYYPATNPPGIAGVVAIATGADAEHCLALKSDGTISAWGYGVSGETSVPGTLANVVAIAAGYQFSVALRANGTLVAWGSTQFAKTTVPGFSDFIGVALGSDHGLGLRANGTVVGWGRNDYGQINVPLAATNVVAVSAAATHSIALRSDGVILGWGSLDYGASTPPTNASVLGTLVMSHGIPNSNVPGTYAVTYTGTNLVGGVGMATRTVTVVDTTPPILTLLGPNPMTLSLGTAFVDPGATAFDACAGDLTATIVRTGNVNTSIPGSYNLTYTVSDPSGNSATNNRTVLVTGPPSILSFSAFFSGTNTVTGSPTVQFLAEIDPNGQATTAFVQYGLTTNYAGTTTSVSIPASFNPATFYGTLDGLLPGGTYHFRIVANNSLGPTAGPDQTFTVPQVFRPGDLNGDGRVDAGELAAVVSNYLATGTGLLMTNPLVLGNGRFQFGITNDTGWHLSVLSSTNLHDWTLLPQPATTIFQFVDPTATNAAPRFYRIRSP